MARPSTSEHTDNCNEQKKRSGEERANNNNCSFLLLSLVCACVHVHVVPTRFIVVLYRLLRVLFARERDGGRSGGLSAGVEVDHARAHLPDALEDLAHIIVRHIRSEIGHMDRVAGDLTEKNI